TVERLAGDELVAVFGVPERHEDDALRASRAALQIRQAVRALPEIGIRAALVTGEVVAPGAAVREPVVGAPLTLAQRLAALCRDGEVLVDDATLDLVGDAAVARQVAPLAVPGLASPVAAFRLEGLTRARPRTTRALMPFVGRDEELGALETAFRKV